MCKMFGRVCDTNSARVGLNYALAFNPVLDIGTVEPDMSTDLEKRDSTFFHQSPYKSR